MVIRKKSSINKKYYETIGQGILFGYDNIHFKTIIKFTIIVFILEKFKKNRINTLICRIEFFLFFSLLFNK